MKAFAVVTFVSLTFVSTVVHGQSDLDAAHKMEASGDTVGARAALSRAVAANPNSIPALTADAEFLDRYGDPRRAKPTRNYWRRSAVLATGPAPARLPAAWRRLTCWRAIARLPPATWMRTTRARARAHRWVRRGGEHQRKRTDGAHSRPHALLRPHGRHFAGCAPRRHPAALARNVVTNGYQASHSNEALEQTEYLKLVHRYLSQARELEKLAGDAKGDQGRELRIARRGRTAAHPGLPHARRLRLRSGAGNRQRGARLPHHRLRFPHQRTGSRRCAPTGRSPTTTIRPTCPCFSARNTGLAAPRKRSAGDFIETFISDPSLCRLYLGISKLDRETAEALRKAITLHARCKAYAHVLDFFGGMFEIRDGKAVVPGGQRSAAAWARTGGRLARQGRRVLRQADGQGRRLAGQPLRCAGAHPRPGAGLPDRARRA